MTAQAFSQEVLPIGISARFSFISDQNHKINPSVALSRAFSPLRAAAVDGPAREAALNGPA
jgi:hypothetical protein